MGRVAVEFARPGRLCGGLPGGFCGERFWMPAFRHAGIPGSLGAVRYFGPGQGTASIGARIVSRSQAPAHLPGSQRPAHRPAVLFSRRHAPGFGRSRQSPRQASLSCRSPTLRSGAWSLDLLHQQTPSLRSDRGESLSFVGRGVRQEEANEPPAAPKERSQGTARGN